MGIKTNFYYIQTVLCLATNYAHFIFAAILFYILMKKAEPVDRHGILDIMVKWKSKTFYVTKTSSWWVRLYPHLSQKTYILAVRIEASKLDPPQLPAKHGLLIAPRLFMQKVFVPSFIFQYYIETMYTIEQTLLYIVKWGQQRIEQSLKLSARCS